MKRLLTMLLVTGVLCGAAVLAAAEETYTAAGFEYALTDGGNAEIIRYKGGAGTVIIPKTLDGHMVTNMRQNPFMRIDRYGNVNGVENCTVKVEVDHPYLATIDGVLFVKESRTLVFYPSSATDTVYEIRSGIQRIGDYAFYGCSSLTSVTIPGSVTSIGNSAFRECSSLTSLTIPDGVTSIGNYAFKNCDSLPNVTIPDGVTSIGHSSFAGCDNLVSATIPDSVTSIGGYAFCWCSSLTSVTIPDGVTSIGEKAFGSCSSLTSVTIPDSVVRIERDAFGDCSSDLVISVTSGSYGEQYCKENRLQYVTTGAVYGDDDSWLD